MVRKTSAAQARIQFSALVTEAAQSGKRVLIERRGKPLAALVSTSDLEWLEGGRTTSSGSLALNAFEYSKLLDGDYFVVEVAAEAGIGGVDAKLPLEATMTVAMSSLF
ncbi:MAG: type II toxin-antitoxin system Phd/YefM family antitoxin [Dehalococcoidia bacterium]|nr:type II toxin-antitoxin system Phd/YefM family antitoxin [Dehalococcoidia bacterium]